VTRCSWIGNEAWWGRLGHGRSRSRSSGIGRDLLCALIGVPVGIAAAHRPRFFATLRPLLDLMQTLPSFVYLIPTLVLFGLGPVPGLISTVIFALARPHQADSGGNLGRAVEFQGSGGGLRLEAGFAIVLVAIMLDQVFRPTLRWFASAKAFFRHVVRRDPGRR
jgi:ABC-type proline/glycine betaine transport system permease subunit